jgi:hypothetical protein
MFSILACALFSCVKQYKLEIGSTPSKAIVLINGVPACYETPCVQVLEKGVYQIDVQAAQFAPQSFSIPLDGDKSKHVELLSKGGWLNISSNPSNIPIVLEGGLIGRTPITEYSLKTGVHSVRIHDGCFEKQEKKVDIPSGKEVDIQFSGVPRRIPSSFVVYDPAKRIVQGNVFIDGGLVGKTGDVLSIPLCTQNVMILSGVNWAHVSLNLEEPKENYEVFLTPIPEEKTDGLLGFVPPGCSTKEGINQECTRAWFEKTRMEAEERNSHMHHEGCAHE